MRFNRAVGTIAVVVAVAFGMASPVRADEASTAPEESEPVVEIAGQDAEMNAAIQGARASINVFMETALAQEGAVGMLKVAVPHDGGVEFLWMYFQRVADGKVFGVLDNDGAKASVKAGDPYTAPMDAIADWMVFYPPLESGSIFGSLTTRVMAERKPELFDPAFLERLQPLPKD